MRSHNHAPAIGTAGILEGVAATVPATVPSVDDPIALDVTLRALQDALARAGQVLDELGERCNASRVAPGLTPAPSRSRQATVYQLARELIHAAAMTHQAVAGLERAQGLCTQLCYDVHFPVPDVSTVPEASAPELSVPRRVPGMSL